MSVCNDDESSILSEGRLKCIKKLLKDRKIVGIRNAVIFMVLIKNLNIKRSSKNYFITLKFLFCFVFLKLIITCEEPFTKILCSFGERNFIRVNRI